MRRESWGTALVALAAAGWGTWALFLRGHGLLPAWQSVMILSVIAAASLPFALSGAGRPARTLSLGAWAQLALAAFFDAGNYILYFAAVDRGPVGTAVLTHYLAPVLVALSAPWMLREPLGPRTPPALLAALAGLSLLVLGGSPGAALPAALLGAGSAVFYAGNTLVTKRLLEVFSPAELLSYHCLLSAALVTLFALGAHAPAPPLRAFLWSPVAGALCLGAAGASCFYLGLRIISAQRAAVLTYLEPLVATVVGSAAFGERLGPAAIFGAALIAGGGLAVALPSGARKSQR